MGCVCCCLRENTLEDQEHQTIGCLHLYRYYIQHYFDMCHSLFHRRDGGVVPTDVDATFPLVPTSQVNTEDNNTAALLPEQTSLVPISLVNTEDNNTAVLLSEQTSVSVRCEKVARKEKNGSTDGEGSNTCHSGSLQPSPRLTDGVTCFYPSSDDEDECPICLEEYTTENPRSTLQCSHQFHLGCVYEWMERSPSCPFCSELMFFKEDV